jgi:hypothetical protein
VGEEGGPIGEADRGAAGVLMVNPGIDRAYVERWASELGILELWREIDGDRR